MAPNVRLAKMASDKRKPDGQFSVNNDEITTFLADMPIRKFNGIGPAKQEKLQVAFGIHTGADFRAKIGLIRSVEADKGDKLLKMSIGWDNSFNTPRGPRQSILKSYTFTSTADMEVIKSILSHICDELAKELQAEKKYASTVTIKYKLKGELVEKPVSRSVSCRTSSEFLRVAFSIVKPVKGEIRMVGVVASTLVPLPTTTIDAFLSAQPVATHAPLPPPKRPKTAKQTKLSIFFGTPKS